LRFVEHDSIVSGTYLRGAIPASRGTTTREDEMDAKLTLDMDSLRVTTFETDTVVASTNAAVSLNTLQPCCGTGCNTRLTCSTNLC
jgi:hypothetical protein